MNISPKSLREIKKKIKSLRVDSMQYGYGEGENYGEGFNDGLDEAVAIINEILKENE